MKAVVADGCSLKYAVGSSETGASGVSINSVHGLCALINCAADANVTGRHIRVGPDVPRQLRPEALAKPHHFIIALPFRFEVRAAFAAAHLHRPQRILPPLFPRAELHNAECPALV